MIEYRALTVRKPKYSVSPRCYIRGLKKVKMLLILKILLIFLALVILCAISIGETACPYALLAFVIFVIVFRLAYWVYTRMQKD
jgi:hypothetical protein